MSKTRISELVLFALLSIIVWTGGEANHLPPCGKTGDTYGSWFNSTEGTVVCAIPFVFCTLIVFLSVEFVWLYTCGILV